MNSKERQMKDARKEARKVEREVEKLLAKAAKRLDDFNKRLAKGTAVRP
jgi:vacuolar-type H+-ATPase subunit H